MKLSDLISTVKNNLAQQQKDGTVQYVKRQSATLANILSEFNSIRSILLASNRQLQTYPTRTRVVSKPSFVRGVGSAVGKILAPLARRPINTQRVPQLSQPVAIPPAPLASTVPFQQQEEQQAAEVQQQPAFPVGIDDVLKAAALIATANVIKQTDFRILTQSILARSGLNSEIVNEIEDKAVKTRKDLQEEIQAIDNKLSGKPEPEPQPQSQPGQPQPAAAGKPQPQPGQPRPAAVGKPTPAQETKPLARPPAVTTPSAGSPSRPSPTTTEFIKSKEGKYFAKATWDEGAYAVGYGHLIKGDEIKQGFIDLGNGDRVTVAGDQGKDTTITKDQAEKLLAKDINVFEKKTADLMGDTWNKLTEPQKTALVSYAYNTGPGGFAKSLLRAGLKEAINEGNTEKAAMIIQNGINTAGGKYSQGLANRRKEEADLFRSGSKQLQQKDQQTISKPTATSNKPAPQSAPQQNVAVQQNQKTATAARTELPSSTPKIQPISLQQIDPIGPTLNDRSGFVAFNQQINEEPAPIINVIDNSVYTTERKKSAPQSDSPSAIYSTLT